MPYTEEQLRRRQTILANQDLPEKTLPEEEKDLPEGEELGLGEIFAKSLKKGSAATRMSFRQTKQALDDAESEDAQKRAEGIKELEEAAAREVYRAKYGDAGAEQFKNLSDSKWWAKTLGEAIPGSVPFLAGAGTGATAGFLVGGPAGALAGGMLGGGATVFAQDFGNSYFEYLEENPDDEEGAEFYALKKSGLSSIINAATLPLALVGRSIEPFKRSLIQAVLQAGAETGDNVSSNLLTKKYVDPTLDPTTGIASGIAGELAFEAPAVVSSVNRRHTKYKNIKEREKMAKDSQELIEETLETFAQGQVMEYLETQGQDLSEGAVIDMDILKKAAEENDITVLPGDTTDQVFEKLKGFYKTQFQEVAEKEALEMDLGSEETFEKRFKENTKLFESMAGQELFDYVSREFQGATPEETWSNYTLWAGGQGRYSFTPPAFDSNFYNNPEMEGAWDNSIEAFANATSQMQQKESAPGPITISLEGKAGFRNYIKNLSEKYDREALIRAVQRNRPRDSIDNTSSMSNTELAFEIAELMSINELNRMKNEKMTRPVDINVQRKEGDETKGLPIDINTRDSLSEQGNAMSARVMLYDDLGNEKGKIYFQRQFLENKELENLIDEATQEEGGRPILAEKNLGKLIATGKDASIDSNEFENNYQGKTIDELIVDPISKIPNSELIGMRLVGSSRPLDQREFITKAKGRLSALFRPMGKMGLIATAKQKQTQAALRAHNQTAKEMATDLEKAIIAAAVEETSKKDSVFKTKRFLEAEQEVRRKVRNFIRKTGALVELDPEGKNAALNELDLLEQNPEQNADAIDDLKTLIAGNQKTSVAVQDLPTSPLRKAALRARKSIDVLTERILNEFPPEMLGDAEDAKGATRQILENQLGSYVVSSFALFENQLGFNPKFSAAFIRSPAAQNLIESAIISLETMNAGDPTFTRQDAINIVDDILTQTYFSSSADMASLPGVMKMKNEATAVNLPEGPKLLQERYKIPFAVRRLMGEITDPTLMTATSISRVAKLIEMHNFYRDLKNINNMPGEMMFSQKKIPGVFDFEIPTVDEFNPLKGMWTTKEIAQELGLDTLSQANSWSSVINIYQNTFLRAKAGIQGGMIVLSPGTQTRNFFGAALMFAAGGHLIQGDWSLTNNTIMQELFPGLAYDKDGNIVGQGNSAGEARATMRLARQLGISNTSANLNDAFGIFNEIGSGKYDTAEKVMHALYSLKHLNTETAFTTAMTLPGYAIDKTVGAVFRKLKGTYAAADDYFKLMTWGANIIEIKNSLNRMSEAAVANGFPPLTDELKLEILRDYSSTLTTNIGTYKSSAAVLYRNVTDLDSYTKHLAAHITRNTIPNYDYVGAFAKFWRKLPLGNFIAFPTEMIRVSGNLVQMQVKDATYRVPDELMEKAGLPLEKAAYMGADGKPYVSFLNQRPFHRKAAKRLLIGGGSIVGLPAALVALGQVMYDVDDEDLEAADGIGAEYNKNATRAPTSSVRDDGTGFDYILLDYLMPFTYLQRAYTAVDSSIRDRGEEQASIPESIVDGSIEATIQFLEDYYGLSIAAEVSAQLINNETDTGRQIYNPTDSLGDKLKTIFVYALDNAGPGGYRQGRDLIKAFSEDEDQYTKSGRRVEEIQALLRIAGMTQSTANPNEAVRYYITSITDTDDGIFKRYVESNIAPASFYSAIPETVLKTGITQEYILDQYDDAQRAWFTIQQDIYFKLQDLKKLKVDPDILEEQYTRLTNIQGVDNTTLDNIEEGIFTPWILPPRFQDNYERIREERESAIPWPEEQIADRESFLDSGEISLLSNPDLPTPWTED